MRIYIFNDYQEHGPENIRVATSPEGARALYERIIDEQRPQVPDPTEVGISPREKAYREAALKSFNDIVTSSRTQLACWLASGELCTGDLARTFGWGGTQLHIVETE